ncbi:MAG: SAM-dependent methyltransferase, partial [Pseudomonadota bacterium]
ADISKATALILFLIPQNLERLAPKFYDLKPGTRIVSNTYEIGTGWEPDDTQRLPACMTWCGGHLYIVPAKVEGVWRAADGDLAFDQYFQTLSGTYEMNGIRLPVENGRLVGNEIRFTVNRVEFSGRVTGDTIQGTAHGRTAQAWSAKRVTE